MKEMKWFGILTALVAMALTSMEGGGPSSFAIW